MGSTEWLKSTCSKCAQFSYSWDYLRRWEFDWLPPCFTSYFEGIRPYDLCGTGLLDWHAQHHHTRLATRLGCCPTKTTGSIRVTLVVVRVPSDVSSFVFTSISNENGKLLHKTPEAVIRRPEAATVVTLLLPVNWGVLMSPDWNNTSTGSWCSTSMSRCQNWPMSQESYGRIPFRGWFTGHEQLLH